MRQILRVVTKQAMSKEETFQDLSLNPPSGKQDLWRWLYTELRGAILDGRLKPGARMPSTRSLGKQYSLSRGTVVAAFDQLQAEGYTRTEVGSGTYVASGVPDGFLSATRKPAALALANVEGRALQARATISEGCGSDFLRLTPSAKLSAPTNRPSISSP